jgi:hypothetical protein
MLGVQSSGFRNYKLDRYRCNFERKYLNEKNVGAGVVLPPFDDSTLGVAVLLTRKFNPVRNPVLG